MMKMGRNRKRENELLLEKMKLAGSYQLTEKVYSGDLAREQLENENELWNFFHEYASRKRGNNVFKNGFYASMIIMPDKWAAKVNEQDGQDFHTHTNLNLVRFLNGDDFFLTEDWAGRISLHEDESKKIIDEYISVSLLSCEDQCKIFIFCYNNKHTPFQISTVKEILKICKEIKNEYQGNLEISFFNKDKSIEMDQITDEQEKKIEELLNKYEVTEEVRQSVKT